MRKLIYKETLAGKGENNLNHFTSHFERLASSKNIRTKSIHRKNCFRTVIIFHDQNLSKRKRAAASSAHERLALRVAFMKNRTKGKSLSFLFFDWKIMHKNV